jgi:DNA-binding NarL/FixJ family response regulator
MIGIMDTMPARVLVIENHPMMRAALCAAIAEESDLQVVEPATEGENSYQLTVSSQQDVFFCAGKPDLILLALGNPGLEELEALKRLRESLPEAPILALTSNEVEGQEQAAAEAGAQMVLTKAAQRRELLQALRELYTHALRTHPETGWKQEVK